MGRCIDETSLKQIAELIQKKEITEISFVLSEDNSIALGALSSQNFSKIRGLKESYKKFNNHKKNVMDSWKTYNYHTLILSYHLNQKIRELEIGLLKYFSNQPKIKGKLYSKPYNSFRNVYSNLICIKSNSLN
jgi:hypothetical protein